MSINAETRRQLAQLARSSRTRTTAFSPQQPTDWRPHRVRNPAGGLSPTYTDGAAWELIAARLDEGHEVEVVDLRKPPGAKGYVMKITLGHDEPAVYVKLQLRGRQIVGRSFHYSHYSTRS